jgi:hypothetical protein
VQSPANQVCEYCLALANYSFHPFPIDHIVPLSKGGSSAPDNLAYACQFCNNSKYDKISAVDPLTGIVAPLYNPRIHTWAKHFTWNEDFTMILGITPTGRGTVICLDMNRIEAVNLRSALRAYGVYPPG